MIASPVDLHSRSVANISEYRQLLQKDGFIYVETGNSSFDWIEFAKSITGGKLGLQYGKEVFQVQLEPEFVNFSDARGAKPLLPHTEATDYLEPPKYLALWCHKPADCGGGITTLASIKGFLETLSAQEKQKLVETHHYFGAIRGVHASRTKGSTHPILSFSGEKPVFRFSCNYIQHGDYSPDPDNLGSFTPDPFLAEINDKLLAYYEQNHLAIRMKKHSLLLWDNECMIHCRTVYQDTSRKLERIFLS